MPPQIPTIIVENASNRESKRRRLDLDTYAGHTQWTNGYQWHEGRDIGRYFDDANIQLTSDGDRPWDSAATSVNPVSNCYTDLESRSDSIFHSEITSESTSFCFGMIMDLPVTTRCSSVTSSLASTPIYLSSENHVHCCTGGDVIGTLDGHAAETLAKLAADGELELQLSCSFPANRTQQQQKQPSCVLRAIIYGPRNRAEDVGDFVDKCGYYLQDPLACDRNVPYYNPHTLSSLDGYLPMTFDLEMEREPLSRVEDYTQTVNDILAGFESTEMFVQTPTPRALRTQLSTHQKQALTFFKRRERGLHPAHNDLGIWRRSHDATRPLFFINTISDRQQSEQPPIWNGGILADEMGLGKTLSMIALIASDKDAHAGNSLFVASRTPQQVINSTLVVVPPSVLSVWETQIKTHVHPGQITWFKHHGKNRFNSETASKQPNIVFTTYQTVEFERRRSAAGDSIFSFRWNRIILDEAHVIRNSKTSTAKAIASLQAVSRWAVSGTPIQNGLTDFLGLFKFLHFHPYDDPKVFDADISQLWRSGQTNEAVQKFKRLLDCIMTRRLKATVELPPRYDKIVHIPFDPWEREKYRKVERPVAEMLGNTMETCGNVGRLWFNAVEQINKLRLVCNLGVSMAASRSLQALPAYENRDSTSGLLATRLSMGGTSCDQCLQIIELPEARNQSERKFLPNVYYSRCFRVYCSGCASLLQFETPKPCECDPRASPCSIQRIPMIQLTPRVTPSEGSPSPEPTRWDNNQISSKVRTLVSEIQAHPHEKGVVFSSWTSSLDMVQRALQLADIRCVRIDGKVSTKNRTRALEQFNQNLETKVMLLTISCGAVGIDLTTASRAHLLEPQWNPSIEDQALARIHRIGQTRPVTTTRYVMEDSFEEHILNVQDRKKLLATLLLSNGDASKELRSLVHGT